MCRLKISGQQYLGRRSGVCDAHMIADCKQKCIMRVGRTVNGLLPLLWCIAALEDTHTHIRLSRYVCAMATIISITVIAFPYKSQREKAIALQCIITFAQWLSCHHSLIYKFVFICVKKKMDLKELTDNQKSTLKQVNSIV